MSIIDDSFCRCKDLTRFSLDKVSKPNLDILSKEEFSLTERRNLNVFRLYRQQLDLQHIEPKLFINGSKKVLTPSLQLFIKGLKKELTFSVLERLGFLFTWFLWFFLKLPKDQPRDEELYLLLVAEKIYRKLEPTFKKLPTPLTKVESALLSYRSSSYAYPNID